ncbi:MAG: hypothetical protein C0485_13870 [Pirellula sp.]|nr:hypothetical protein [Pirellula sp.]
MDMRRGIWATLALAAAAVGANSANAQQPEYIDKDGIRYQVIQRQVPTQVPITEMRSQEQTTYRQQVTTENVQHQQVYHVPVTQYQVVSQLHNRWNPFAEPYWTHHYEPVTTWQQQVGTVQIPVSKVDVVPETRTVQQPITTWKTVNNTITEHRAIGPTPNGPGANTMMAAAPSQNNAASATLQPVQSPPAARVASTNQLGGTQLQSDPPRYGAGNANSTWQPPTTAAPIPQTATNPAPAPVSNPRY